jgi:DnaJ family protein B protein 12
MEINKEEAIRCLRIAKNQYGSKNYEAAVRLTKKSISLYSTDEAKEFLVKAEKAAASAPSTPNADTPPPSATEEKTKEREKPSSSQQSSDVREILACGTDYYRVLKVDRNCTEVEMKKSYRKVHLDLILVSCILNF